MLFTEIFSRVKLAAILIAMACFITVISKKVKVKHGPSGMSFDDFTNCSEFSKYGRFNPLSVLREKWFVFYYWGPLRGYTTFIFTFPSANHTKHLKKLLNGNVILPVMWSARQILMEDNEHYISLLVERGDRGEYWLYPVGKVQKGHKITPRDIRMKQTGDNRLVGFMDCLEQSLLVMARLNDVPRKDKLLEEAMRLGYRGRRGKSYLYQGHEWGPIPEANEELFWDYSKKHIKDTSTQDNSSEGRSEEEESQPTNKEEPDSKEKKRKASENKTVQPATRPDLDHEMCVKVEPELWDDPKPNPNPDPSRITKEQLDNFDNTSGANNTLIIETSHELSNEKEKKNDNKSEKMQENDKLANQKDVQIAEVEVNEEQNNIELDTEDTDPEEDEDCVVCYKSQVSYEPYRPVHSPDNNLKNEVPHTEVPRTEAPSIEPRVKEPIGKKALAKEPSTPKIIRPDQLDLTNSSEIIIMSPKTLDDLKS